MLRAFLLAGVLGLALIAPAMAEQDETDQDRHEHGRRGERGGMMGGMMGGGGMERLMPFARAFANGVFFRVRVGDNEIDMHCPASLPLSACVTSATELMKAMQQSQ